MSKRLQRVLESLYHGLIIVKTDGSTEIRPEYFELFIDCAMLIEPCYVLCRIAKALCLKRELEDPTTLMQTPQEFVHFLNDLDTSNGHQLVVFLQNAEVLLREDPVILWTLSHINELLPQRQLSIRLVLATSVDTSDFSNVLGCTAPLIIELDNQKLDQDALVDSAVRKHYNILTSNGEEITLNSLTALVQNIYSISKDQVSNAQSFMSFVNKILPLYLKVARSRNIPLEDTTRLYHASIKQISSIVNGETYREALQMLVSKLSVTERVILLAAYIASHNPAKFDLRLFGNIGKRARISKKIKQSKTTLKLNRTPPKTFPLDRMLAIFYFIVPSPVPKLRRVYDDITLLVNRGLLNRATVLSRLDVPKFKCTLPIDFVSPIGKAVNIDISKYLLSSY